MRSRIVRDLQRRGFDAESERSRGLGPAGMRLASTSFLTAGAQVPNRLPVRPGQVKLQNSSGQLIFLVGYSAVGGPDVSG